MLAVNVPSLSFWQHYMQRRGLKLGNFFTASSFCHCSNLSLGRFVRYDTLMDTPTDGITKYGCTSVHNFLVADYLFTSSTIFPDWQLVGLNHLQDEDRCRLSPYFPRPKYIRSISALGCVINEISTGLQPYEAFDDSLDGHIHSRYIFQFPTKH